MVDNTHLTSISVIADNLGQGTIKLAGRAWCGHGMDKGDALWVKGDASAADAPPLSHTLCVLISSRTLLLLLGNASMYSNPVRKHFLFVSIIFSEKWDLLPNCLGCILAVAAKIFKL